MKQLILLFSLVIGHQALAQETITIPFDDELTHTNVRGRGFVVLYELEEDRIYYKKDTSFREIVKPKGFNLKNPAYGFLYYEGKNEGALENNITFLVDDFEKEMPTIFVDGNNNLNFQDDGSPLHYATDSTTDARIKNAAYKGAISLIRLKKLNLSEGEQKKRLEEYLLPKGVHAENSKALGIDYWFSDESINNKIGQIEVGGRTIKIGIRDSNVNGLFNDIGTDVVMIGDSTRDFISPRKSEGAVNYEKDKLISVLGTVFEVTEVHPLGKYMKLTKSDKKLDLSIGIGDPVPPITVKLLGQPYALELSALVEKIKKYTILEAWGSWCKPCLEHLPDLKELQKKHSDKLAIIGMNYGDSAEKAQKFVDDNEVKWSNVILSQKLKEALKVEGFPTYILVDPQGKIVSLNATLKQIEDILEGE